MNLLIFGPPGIGKSTVIAKLKERNNGFIVYDIEKVWDDKPMKGRIRSFMSTVIPIQKEIGLAPIVMGAAGFDPSQSYPGFSKVLLTARQREYIQRRDLRNGKHPELAKQGEHDTQHWERLTRWNAVIDTTGMSVESVVDFLTKLALSHNSH